jgi:ATP adenylyltransferase/5',5'''-P-1,P-4-tetraphosphate phosphorylase II
MDNDRDIKCSIKFCPVVPEICRGQVHVPRKERKKQEEEENNNNKKRSKNNKSPNVVWEIPDIEKFLPVAIFKMAATILQKFNIVRYHQNLIRG